MLAQIKTWLDTEGQVVLPRSPLGAAITYAQNLWRAITTYTTQGFLAIDNNASERALKRVAIGRKALITFCQPSMRTNCKLASGAERRNLPALAESGAANVHRRSIQFF